MITQMWIHVQKKKKSPKVDCLVFSGVGGNQLSAAVPAEGRCGMMHGWVNLRADGIFSSTSILGE